jgi:hypothetical protein
MGAARSFPATDALPSGGRQNGRVRRRRRILLVLVVIAVAALVIRGSVRGNQVFGNAAGRTIVAETAHVLHGAELTLAEAAATVTLGDLSATVTTERVELPDGTTVAIPADCKTVELRERAGRIDVKLDGVAAN